MTWCLLPTPNLLLRLQPSQFVLPYTFLPDYLFSCIVCGCYCRRGWFPSEVLCTIRVRSVSRFPPSRSLYHPVIACFYFAMRMLLPFKVCFKRSDGWMVLLVGLVCALESRRLGLRLHFFFGSCSPSPYIHSLLLLDYQTTARLPHLLASPHRLSRRVEESQDKGANHVQQQSSFHLSAQDAC